MKDSERYDPQELASLSPTVRYDRLLEAVFPHLNAVHGIDRSRRYWAIVLHRYLRKCLMAGDVGLDPERPALPPTHDNDILGAYVGGGGKQTNLASRPSMLRRVKKRLPAIHPSPAGVRTWLRLRQLRTTLVDRSPSILFGFHYFHVVADLVEQPSAMLQLPRQAIPASPAWDARREALADAESDVVWPLARLALRWLPTWYVEEFDARDASVPVRDPTEREFHASFLWSPEGRFFIARHVEEGSALTMYQHAGTYGELAEDVAHHSEAVISDRFRTWGWELLPGDSPLLALRLLKPPGQTIRRLRPVPRWLYIHIRDPYPWFIGETVETQDRFFAELQVAKAAKVLLRPRAVPGGSSDPQIGPRARSVVAGIDGGTLSWAKVGNRSEIVILDAFPTTLFLECLHAGIPVVAIVPETVCFTEVAAPFYEEFARAGILHANPESAARFLNSLDIPRWWSEVESSTWFQEYMRTFCRTEL
ncbi:MAG: hypothetical protein WEG36_06125 [Gemmatimonadota bacterium]